MKKLKKLVVMALAPIMLIGVSSVFTGYAEVNNNRVIINSGVKKLPTFNTNMSVSWKTLDGNNMGFLFKNESQNKLSRCSLIRFSIDGDSYFVDNNAYYDQFMSENNSGYYLDLKANNLISSTNYNIKFNMDPDNYLYSIDFVPIDGYFENGEVLQGELIGENASFLKRFFSMNLSEESFSYDFEEKILLEKNPVISGSTTFVNNLNSSRFNSVAEIQSHLSVYDEVDGDLTTRLIYEPAVNDWNDNKNVIGIFSLTFSVTDSSGNKVTAVVKITNNDSVAPSINLNGTIKLSELEGFDLNKIIIVTDVSTTFLTFKVGIRDISLSKKLKYSDYGQELIITAEDSFGNSSTFKKILTLASGFIIDDVAPEFNKPEYSLKTSYMSVLSTRELLLGIVSKDNVGGLLIDCDVAIDNISDYISKSSLIGNVSLNLSSSDTSGNRCTAILNVQIIDDVPPVIYYDNVIVVKSGTLLEPFQLASLVKRVNSSIKSYDILNDNFTENYKKCGNYEIKMKLNYIDDTSEIKDIAVNVIDEFNNSSLNFFEKIGQQITSMFNSIGDFFKKCWNWISFNGWSL